MRTLEASAEQVRGAEELILSAFRKSLDEYLQGRLDPRPQPADDRTIFGLADKAVSDYHAATARDQSLAQPSPVPYWGVLPRPHTTHRTPHPLRAGLSLAAREPPHRIERLLEHVRRFAIGRNMDRDFRRGEIGG